MLSILIPTYNYNIVLLVEELKSQLDSKAFTHEIIVADDASSDKHIIEKNEYINKFTFCSHLKLDKNLGRSKIRNFLANEARYDTLLFLDADVIPLENSFIDIYMDHIPLRKDIVYGGITYQEKKPPTQQMLRWKYGNKKEALLVRERKKKPYISFLTLNFLIKKSVFRTTHFNEDIPNLRCEDTLFALEAKKNNLTIDHINNPVVHLGLETSEIFLRKSLESIDVRKMFVNEKLLDPKETKITQLGTQLAKLKLQPIIIAIYKLTGKMLKKNILSSKPSLAAFDLYRLGYYFDSKER